MLRNVPRGTLAAAGRVVKGRSELAPVPFRANKRLTLYNYFLHEDREEHIPDGPLSIGWELIAHANVLGESGRVMAALARRALYRFL